MAQTGDVYEKPVTEGGATKQLPLLQFPVAAELLTELAKFRTQAPPSGDLLTGTPPEVKLAPTYCIKPSVFIACALGKEVTVGGAVGGIQIVPPKSAGAVVILAADADQ